MPGGLRLAVAAEAGDARGTGSAVVTICNI
jgi:hypothetical protein